MAETKLQPVRGDPQDTITYARVPEKIDKIQKQTELLKADRTDSREQLFIYIHTGPNFSPYPVP